MKTQLLVLASALLLAVPAGFAADANSANNAGTAGNTSANSPNNPLNKSLSSNGSPVKGKMHKLWHHHSNRQIRHHKAVHRLHQHTNRRVYKHTVHRRLRHNAAAMGS